MQSATHAPEYALHRDAVASADTIANVPQSQGINLTGYHTAKFQVVPTGGANPALRVYVWSPGADRWVQRVDASWTISAQGADTPYEFELPVQSSKIFVAVTTIAAGSVSVYVAGYYSDYT